jgi:pre-mRNA-splicing factor CWC26
LNKKRSVDFLVTYFYEIFRKFFVDALIVVMSYNNKSNNPRPPKNEAHEKLLKEAQREWGKGTAQKKEIETIKDELIQLASQPFARTVDDPQLEKIRKSKIRSEDPFAEYFLEKKRKYEDEEGSEDDDNEDSRGKDRKHKDKERKPERKSNKPLYKGPNSVPNRFGIRPGYRWDAIDRSNGFESKLFTALSEKEAFNEDSYKWAVADM